METLTFIFVVVALGYWTVFLAELTMQPPALKGLKIAVGLAEMIFLLIQLFPAMLHLR